MQEWLAAQILATTEPRRPALERLLARPPAGDVLDRLGVHRGGYPARLEAALTDSYPAVAHLIGAGAGHGLVHRWARWLGAAPRHPYNLNETGESLPGFLAGDPLTADLPFLPELATLEWAIATAFHARDEAPFDATSLATWDLADFDRARLRFQPSLSLVRSKWPIVDLWEARETPVGEIDLDLRDRPQIAVVHRRGFAVACRLADPLEAECLGQLLRGRHLGKVAGALAGRCGEGAVAAWFSAWVAAGLVTACVRSERADP